MKNKKYKLNEENKTVTYCNNDKCITKTYAKHFNTPESIILAKNKFKTSSILIKNNIPVPKFIKIEINDSIENIITNMNKNKISNTTCVISTDNPCPI